MNIATSRFTLSTIAVALCAMVALVAAGPAQAGTAAPRLRSEAASQPVPVLHRFVVVGQRHATPTVQRIEIVGQRLRTERVATAPAKVPAL